MSEMSVGWKTVLSAFDNWIYYETEEFGPWTTYFSPASLRDLTSEERLGWMQKMQEELIPGRIESCRQASIALEDFLPYMPDPSTRETVQSMISLSGVIQDAMLRMSDIVAEMMNDYQAGGLDDIAGPLEAIADTEEDIRHHMSLYSKGFAKLKSLGLEIPEEMT